MGLEFSHTDAYFSFRTFHMFRQRIARMAGINLDEMEGYSDPGKPWSDVDDPLVPLLHRSDCDGEISPADCERLAPRLLQLLDAWQESDGDALYAYAQLNGRKLVRGMENCIAMDHSLQFYG